jgi:hypothetical protein
VVVWNPKMCVFVLSLCVVGHNKELDGARKRGRKPQDEAYVDTRTTTEKTMAWHFARAVQWRFIVNHHALAATHARTHVAGGVIVSLPPMQLSIWGGKLRSLSTSTDSTLSVGVQLGGTGNIDYFGAHCPARTIYGVGRMETGEVH